MLPWESGRIFLIAEAGVNHNGSVQRAEQMLDLAASAGADAVKFQTFRAEAFVTADAGMADYQARNTGSSDGSQFEMLRALELPPEAHFRLQERARDRGILFFSTAFDDASIDLLEGMGQPVWKIPSGELTNYPYLVRLARLGKPLILSTGMATLAEVESAVATLEAHGVPRERLCVLHCTTEYPAPLGSVNLLAMPAMGEALGVTFGYSDHTTGALVSIAAAALGAKVLEKHFTLDKNLPGPDHSASLSPEELREWVAAVRSTERALGSRSKQPVEAEEKNRLAARKIVVAARFIRTGEAFSSENLAVKRAGRAGISPMKWPELIGRAAPRDFVTDEPIET